MNEVTRVSEAKDTRLVSVAKVAPAPLDSFLKRAFGEAKGSFLKQHGAWWHGGNQHRLILLVGEEIAGYCAVIPSTCYLEGQAESALWWVDLVIAPEFRGRGLQGIFDQEIRNRTDLKLGFPNELAAKIHRKHAWGVREDLQVFLMPLRPRQVKTVEAAQGARRGGLKTIATILELFASLWRLRLNRYVPVQARAVTEPDPDLLASIFIRYVPSDLATTYRNASYFKWRYLEAPYPLSYYLAGPETKPTHYLIARHLIDQGVKTTRILDVFGDFEDRHGLHDVMMLAAKEAVQAGSSQITLMVTLPEIQPQLRSLGFVFRTRARFCWHSTSANSMHRLGQRVYWTLGDSDNDEIPQ